MFRISIEGGFHASHYVKLPDGTIEKPHAHDWLVRIIFYQHALDELGMVADFHVAQIALTHILDRLHNTDLNQHRSLQCPYPTAEIVAKYIAGQMSDRGIAPIWNVQVTEAQGCVATFIPPREA